MKHYSPSECCELHSQRHSFTSLQHSCDNLNLKRSTSSIGPQQCAPDHNNVPHHVMLTSLWHYERIQIIAVHDINIVMPVRNVSNSKPINAMAIPNPVCNLQHNSETCRLIKVYTQHKTSIVFNMLMSSDFQSISASFWCTLWIHQTGNVMGTADKCEYLQHEFPLVTLQTHHSWNFQNYIQTITTACHWIKTQ